MPEQCEACREDAAFLAGTDHDLFIFASSAKNRLGETASAVDDKSNPGLKGPHVSPLLLMKWGFFLLWFGLLDIEFLQLVPECVVADIQKLGCLSFVVARLFECLEEQVFFQFVQGYAFFRQYKSITRGRFCSK
jgi:hypothetical protein